MTVSGCENTPWYSLLLMERTLARLTRAELTAEVHQVIGLPLKEADIVVCTIIGQHRPCTAIRQQGGDSGIRHLQHAPEEWAYRAQSKDRRSGRSGAEENSVLQSEQGTPPTD